MIVLTFFVISSLKKITDTIKTIETEVKEVSDGLTPMISETTEVMKDLAVLSENVKADYNKARPVIENLIHKAQDITQTLGKISNGAKEVTKFAFPVLTGVSTALKFFKK
jgi:uncharacterized protein YoxC